MHAAMESDSGGVVSAPGTPAFLVMMAHDNQVASNSNYR